MLFDENIESVFVEIVKSAAGTNQDVVVGQIYRPPNTNVDLFNECISSILQRVKRENKILYLLGDYNINILNADTHTSTSEFLEIMYESSLFPVITKPTRVRDDTSTLIDNIFTNDIVNGNFINGIIVSALSDHFPVFCINRTAVHSEVQHIYKYRDYGVNNIETFRSSLLNSNLENLISNKNCQEAFTSFYDVYKSIYNDCFPVKTSKSMYCNRKPWLTMGLKTSIRMKNKLFYKSKDKPTPDNVSQYKTYRNTLNTALRTAEKEYYERTFNDLKHNLKKSWAVIKSVINKNKKGTLPTSFRINNVETKNTALIANAFNKTYANNGKTLASKIPNVGIDPMNYISEEVNDSIFVRPTDEVELKNVINNLRNSSPGLDGIKANIVKNTTDIISSPLIQILNLSLQEGVFPTELKYAEVVPVYKSGPPNLINNYRPVSLLSCFSKIFERIMYSRIWKFINDQKLLYKFQFGFREGHNTSLALMVLLDEIYNAFNNNEYVIGIFIDLRKAFETIDHKILLRKLLKYGIRGVAHKWFESYLSERYQRVCFRETRSNFLPVKCGVPQGSILGPLLFIIYLNDISKISKKILPILYADDSNLFFRGKSIQQLLVEINQELTKVIDWLNANRLSLNIEKTNYMIFSQCNVILNTDDKVTINGHKVPEYNYKLL